MQRTLASFSGDSANLLGDLMDDTKNLKVVLHDFQEGDKVFELVARFWFNKGRTEITPTDVVLLNLAVQYIEMESDDGPRACLLNQTRKSLDGVGLWTWYELLVALKECQDLLSASNSSSILDKVLSCVVERLGSLVVASPYASSLENSSLRIRNSLPQISWWFEDLLFLNIDLIYKLIRTMISRNIDHDTVSKFLLCYRRSRFLSASLTEKCKIIEVTINLLSLLNKSSLPFKLLFGIFRVASSLKISRHCKSILENLIGLQLDQATIDFLLLPSPHRRDYVYDVNLVMRLVKTFCKEGSCFMSAMRLKRVASLVDSFLVEVAADSHLNPSKFAALVMVLPDGARESHDRLFQAIDIYLEVHDGLCEAKKMRICSALNYAKLSTDALRHLARNSKFPSRIAIQVYINQQSKLESLFDGQNHLDSDTFTGPIFGKESVDEKASSDQILLYAKRINLDSKADQLDVKLQGMQRRVTELENTVDNADSDRKCSKNKIIQSWE
ncbi:Eukaryotic translation initiation factor-related, putative isoform 1 [Hibiscus syriacus]|uniref:Eukaryotic translation initiation factor-related, putative isoform 1 n=1 Tax=Hibiscus syriacus TaxID=106335 RepID=A0A6A3CHM4_HIBSY|nr:Eukaryotic translation initiation factor-related, putative isoform 1 [Hibiscus syriacus]